MKVTVTEHVRHTDYADAETGDMLASITQATEGGWRLTTFHWASLVTQKFDTREGAEKHADELLRPGYCRGCKREFNGPAGLRAHRNSRSRSLRMVCREG